MESRSLVAPAGTSGEDINGITPRRHEDHEVKMGASVVKNLATGFDG
jgi:hypothetical protein